jgi:CheY-like chemotaxis protein
LRGRFERAPTAERTDIPILIIAASRDELDPVLAEQVGADGVILAPIELEQVAADLGHSVAAWREAHPDREWADEQVLGPG